MLLRTPAAVTPDKWRAVQREPEFFIPGTLRVRSYRQQKAGARGRYSTAIYMAGLAPRSAISAQPAGTSMHFPGLPLPCFVRLRHRRKGTTPMTDQLAARYEGTEPFPDVGAPPRTVAGRVRIAVTLAIVIVPFAGLGWRYGLPGPRPEPGGCAAHGGFLPGDGAWSDHRLPPAAHSPQLCRTGTGPACRGNSAAWPMRTSAGCCGMTPPRRRAMRRT
jgi:hypothetical protein